MFPKFPKFPKNQYSNLPNNTQHPRGNYSNRQQQEPLRHNQSNRCFFSAAGPKNGRYGNIKFQLEGNQREFMREIFMADLHSYNPTMADYWNFMEFFA
jgi:hypothetical protein